MPTSTPLSQRASAWDWALAWLLAANVGWTTLCLGGFLPETKLVSSSLTLAALMLWLLGRMLGSGGGFPWERGRPARNQRHAGGTVALPNDPVSSAQQETFLSRPRVHPAGWLLLPFLAYAAGNVLGVTPVGWLGWADWFGWLQLAAMFWLALNGLAAPGPRRLVHATLAGVGVVAVGLAVYQRFVEPGWLMLGRTQAPQFVGRASGSFGIPNSLAALLLLLIPPAAVGALTPAGPRGPRLLAAGLAAIYLMGLVLTISRGAWLSLGVALAAWPLLARGKRWMWRLGAAGGLAAGALAAGLALYFALAPVRARFEALAADAGERTRPIMWRGAWRLFQDSPVFGTGAGSYNVLFERHRPENYRDEPHWAHNDYLNTLSDYGVAGFALLFGAAAAIAILAWCAARRAPETDSRSAGLARAILVGLGAFALALLVDFHLKIPALALAVAVCAAEAVRRAWPVPERETGWRGRVVVGVAALAVVSVTFGLVLPHDRAEAARYEARRRIDTLADAEQSRTTDDEKSVVLAARAAFARATLLDPGNAQAWADLSYALSLAARHEPAETLALGRDAEAAARRAVALAPVVSEFWWRLGVALDMQGRWVDAGAAFARGLELAPHSARAWYYQAYHLSLKPATQGLARAALTTCLRLDPGNRAAETLREKWVARQ
ncbi:MAG TPA: O-antigen ligase family protein [Opitutaceae bacterium]